ncbi:hypothetical protein DPMN_167346 [Dreissena polymorpha]|uniref:Uncharacterized protein n=1 Tax=Dreissena polymorpha TaxID=45954 RepID=A0A9D4EYN1_DREPO|nr:hypothetical protein DPMN_167346 [Dreissena polymorpha]
MKDPCIKVLCNDQNASDLYMLATDIEISAELIIRGCAERSSSDVDRCISVGDTQRPINPMVKCIFEAYDHFSMNAKSCISEHPI